MFILFYVPFAYVLHDEWNIIIREFTHETRNLILCFYLYTLVIFNIREYEISSILLTHTHIYIYYDWKKNILRVPRTRICHLCLFINCSSVYSLKLLFDDVRCISRDYLLIIITTIRKLAPIVSEFSCFGFPLCGFGVKFERTYPVQQHRGHLII